MTKSALAIFVLASPLAANQLTAGARYDFYQNNGQNLLGAELIEESQVEYTVKLRYIPKPLKIAKRNLAKPPLLSRDQPSPTGPLLWGRTLRPTVYAGYSAFILGPLRDIFRTGYQAGLGVDWYFLRRPFFGLQAISFQGSFALQQSSPRSVRQIQLYAGPQFRLYQWKNLAVDFVLTPLLGMSFVWLKGYTFSAEYRAFSAMAILQAEKKFQRVVVGIMLYTNYLFDQSLNFTATGVGVSAQYPFSF